ncbi:MAG: hypothetical protein M3Y83_08650 [Actinomycetota bacterium]|nr:hypothetical protein [Actinomycetota bacterium]
MSITDTVELTENSASAPADEQAPEETGGQISTIEETDEPAKRSATSRRVSLSLRTLITAIVFILLAGTAGVLGWLYIGARGQLDAQAQATADRERAQQIATEYAVNAAQMDYQNFGEWKSRLVDGTSPELKEKLTKAADSMEQLLAPMQWTSTARPLSAIVKSDAGGVYTVDAFVSVLTKTMQAPEGLQSTATYSITIDSRKDWLITDVGGIDAALRGSGG